MSENTTTKATANEVFESLTGYEEIAVEKRFGAGVETLADGKPLRLLRALAFVQIKREGSDDAKAYDAAMNLTLAEAQNRFEDDRDLEAGEDNAPEK